MVCQALFFELHPIRKIIMRTLLGGIASAFLDVWENVPVSSSSGDKEEMALLLLKKSVKLNEEGEEEEGGEGSDLIFATFVEAMDISKGFAPISSKKDSKKKKKGGSTPKKGKKKQHNTPSWDGVTRVRQVIDMMLAFPRQYFIDGQKWCSCIVVLLIDFLSHRMRKKLQQPSTPAAANKNLKPLEQELILLACACRQLLASFVPELSSRYETQSKEKANQWRLVILPPPPNSSKLFFG